MKIWIISLLVVSHSVYGFQCKLNYQNKTPAVLEAENLASIQKYTKKIDKMRLSMDQALSTSQINGRNQVRVLNSYLSFSEDRGLLYGQFKKLFVDTEISYLKIINFEKRLKELDELQLMARTKFDDFDHKILQEKCEQYGLGNAPQTQSEIINFLDNTAHTYQREVFDAQKIFIKNYDDYMSVRFGMDDMLKANELTEEMKLKIQAVSKKLGIGDDEIKAYKYLFHEQQGKFNGINELELKTLMNENLTLKKELWENRYKKQVGSYITHLILKARIHSRLVSLASSKIPASNKYFKGLKKVLSSFTKDIIDFEMHTRYSGFISLQINPGSVSKSMDNQIKLLMEANAHSLNPDEYLVALSRSIDGKETFKNLKNYMQDKPEFADLFKRMEEAEKEARVLGDLKIGKGSSIVSNIPFYIFEIASIWAVYEYFDFQVFTTDPGVLSEEGSEFVKILNKDDDEDKLDSNPRIKYFRDSLQNEIETLSHD
jgi:hypothetical protein